MITVESAARAGIVLMVLSTGMAHAADLPAAPPVPAATSPASPWQFEVAIYGWAAGLNGNVGVRGLQPASIDISAITALEHLDGGLMGSFFAKNDRWSFLFDLIYMDVSAETAVGPAGGSTASLGLKQVIASGLAGYRLPLALPPSLEVSGTVGFRYQHLDGDFSLAVPLAPFGASVSGTKDWVDPTVGLLVQYAITDKWFVNAVADVGGFGVASKITAQGFASLGYMWTPSVSSAVGYRILYTDYENDGFVYDVTQQGLFMSLAYHF